MTEEYSLWRARGRLVVSAVRNVGASTGRALSQRSAPGPGVNLLGPPARSFGLGVVTGILADLWDNAGVPLTTLAFVPEGAPPPGRGERLYPWTVAVVNSGQLPAALLQHPRALSPRRRRVGVWHWELSQVPRSQRLGLPLVDEVWATSTFVAGVFSDVTAKPVRRFPMPVEPLVGGRAGAVRERLGLGDRLLVATQVDLGSSARRKNAQGVLEAYLRAFPRPGDGIRLLVKAVNGVKAPRDWAALADAASGRPDVVLVDEMWPADLVASLFLDVDCYVSLHRSEGYGLTVAQAMAAGKPVVSTDYGGTTDLVRHDRGVAVPFDLVRVGPDPVYPAEAVWAEPDLDVAADALRDFAAAPDRWRERGRRAGADVRAEFDRARGRAWLARTQGEIP